MRIGELASTSGHPTRTIRFYEARGLLPEPTRASNGYRVYTDADHDRLDFIRNAQTAGLTLAEIASIICVRPTLREALLPPEALVMPAELVAVDRLLNDERFFAPFRRFFDPSHGRPSIPLETYLRLMFLKYRYRYRLGYETLWPHGPARQSDGVDKRWLAVVACRRWGFVMSGFLDKAKEMAETVKDKIEDHIPDSIKEKLHIGNDADDAVEDVAEDVAGEAASTEE